MREFLSPTEGKRRSTLIIQETLAIRPPTDRTLPSLQQDELNRNAQQGFTKRVATHLVCVDFLHEQPSLLSLPPWTYMWIYTH